MKPTWIGSGNWGQRFYGSSLRRAIRFTQEIGNLPDQVDEVVMVGGAVCSRCLDLR